MGDAGCVVSDDFEFNKKLRALRNGGQVVRDDVRFIGMNSRIDELQAGILNIKLKYLDKWNKQRRENAKLYSELLQDIEEVKSMELILEKFIIYML